MGLLITAITTPNTGLNLYEAKPRGQSQGKSGLRRGGGFSNVSCGLSGLAKAFFYAGIRTLQVLSRPVQSNAAVALLTRMLALSGKGAKAHRRAMIAMIDAGPVHNAHPALWAPFVVVGEGELNPLSILVYQTSIRVPLGQI
jgi:hypothetical protein